MDQLHFEKSAFSSGKKEKQKHSVGTVAVISSNNQMWGDKLENSSSSGHASQHYAEHHNLPDQVEFTQLLCWC